MLGAGPSVTLPAPSDGDVAARVRRVRLHPAATGPFLRATARLHRQKMHPQKGPTGPETRPRRPVRLWTPNTRRGYTYAREVR